MLTKEESDFILYWEENGARRKKSMFQYTIGLPMGVLIILALFANIVAGWHKRAAMVLQSNGSMILTVVIAAVGIVVFITFFSVRHKWEQHEQRYQELIVKRDAAEQPFEGSAGL
jgi:membrane protein YdbS with pleckstrin-like domain